MSGKKTVQLEDQIRRYLLDQMTGQERHAFEREMQHDQFLAEAVEGYSRISADFVGADLSYLKNRISKRQKVNRKFIWYAAASVIILVVSSLILFNPKENNKQIISENKIRQKTVTAKKFVTEKKEIVLLEHGDSIKLLPKKNVAKPEVELMIADSEAISLAEATNETGTPSASLLPEQSKLKKSTQSGENMMLAEATKIASDSLALAFREGEPSKNPIRIRGVSSLNNRVTNATGAETQAQPVNAKAENQKVASVTEIQEEKALDEVVVVGYGIQKKVALTGAVAGIKTNQIDDETGINMNQKVDVNASPAIGWIAFEKYLETALLTPAIGLPEQKIVVRLSFVITNTGTIEQIKVLSGKNGRYSEEAIRILTEGPKWNPKVKSQVPQPSTVKLRMVFQPPDK